MPRRRAIRRPVTLEDQRTAYKDELARSIFMKARAARMSTDSALVAYDAMSYSRVSAGMSFLKIGRERLLFRHESVARVQWRQGVGVSMEARGQRTAIPSAPAEVRSDIQEEMGDPDMNASIPYFPGQEPLWIGTGVARAQVNELELINPLADGSEAYYTYETGDSARFTLPDGHTIRLRELKVRPREVKWNLVVGSLWFDTASGQLVRAAYRLSEPMDIWMVAQLENPNSMKDVPAWVKPMITPMKGEISAIAVEYGLYEGRFWLPRLRVAEGKGQASFMHVPFKMEQSFKYASVNAKVDTFPAVLYDETAFRARMPVNLTPVQERAWRDSLNRVVRARSLALRDAVRSGRRVATKRISQCDTAAYRVQTSTQYDGDLRIAVKIPCDRSKLENSPDLPPSIYDPGEELFGGQELELLKAEALAMSAQAPLQLRPSTLPRPTLEYGLSMMRYNRVEGFSFGASAEEQLGGGYSALATGRFGIADREPNLELAVTRTNMTDAVSVSAYNRLVSAGDWGRPLSFGSSFSALMFGRDEGFYYRASGASLSGGRVSSFGGGTRLDWRVFAERQRAADVHSSFAINGAAFPPNIVARRAMFTGVEGRLNKDYGLDPRGLRVLTDARAELARGDSLYGRAALDVTVSHGIGALAAAVTLAGGSSVGALPSQRRWYLGGTHTVRGQSPDSAQSGNAFWLTRVEFGSSNVSLRPTVFTDLGWVGDRARLGDIGRPMSGAGAGISFLDGLFRFDVARGIYPREQYRVDLYLESKF